MKIPFAILLIAPVFCQDLLDGELGTKSDPFNTSQDEIDRIRKGEYKAKLILREEDGSEATDDIDFNNCALPSEEDSNERTGCSDADKELTLGRDCTYKCKPYKECAPRYWLQYYFLVNIGNYQCKPYYKYPIVRSGCYGQCRSYSSINPFPKYYSKKFCQCCDASSYKMGYVILECWPLDWPVDIKPYSKLVWYKYPIVASCDCQQCNDFHFWEKNQALGQDEEDIFFN